MSYENLMLEAEKAGIELIENCNIGRLKGLCVNNIVSLSSKLETDKEKKCILSEELGHYHTSHGNILDQSIVRNRQQERRAKVWAYKQLVPFKEIVKAYTSGLRNRYELADFLEVTEGFLIDAVNYYKEKHGICCRFENYIIYFEPLGVLEKFEGR